MSLGEKVRPPWPTSMRIVFALATAEKAVTARVEKSILAVVFWVVLKVGIKIRKKEETGKVNLQAWGYHLKKKKKRLFGLRKISRT